MGRHMRTNNTGQNAFRHWSRAWRNEIREWLDPGPLLNRAFSIPLGGSIRIFGPEQSGMTALALDIAEAFQKSGGRVMFLDFSHSVFAHRLAGIDQDQFLLPDVHSRADILELTKIIGEEPVMLIVDNVRNIREDWQTTNPALYLRQELRSKCPNVTLVFSELSGKNNWIGEGWDVVLSLTDHENQWENGIRLGHLIEVHGPKGCVHLFISHVSGRIHKPYILARLQEEQGTARSGVFGTEDYSVRGFWQYVYQTTLAEADKNKDENTNDQD